MRIELNSLDELVEMARLITPPSAFPLTPPSEAPSEGPFGEKPAKKKKPELVAEAIEKIDATVAAGNTDAVMTALDKFQVKKVQDLKVADFPEFMKLLDG